MQTTTLDEQSLVYGRFKLGHGNRNKVFIQVHMHVCYYTITKVVFILEWSRWLVQQLDLICLLLYFAWVWSGIAVMVEPGRHRLKNFKTWALSVIYLFRFFLGLDSYFSKFILVFYDLTMLAILHGSRWSCISIVEHCDDSWILKSTVFIDNETHMITHESAHSGEGRVFDHRSVYMYRYVSV